MSGNPPSRCLRSTDVLVLAGGLGTRLHGELGDTPKLLAPIAGRPYLSYMLDWLLRFGARRIVFALGYRADAVLEFLSVRSLPQAEIVSIVEPEPLGTAGAIRFARAQLRTDPVLVMNGDSFVEADLCALLARHRESGALGTVLCTEVERAERYGRVEIDRAGRIDGFVEKGAGFDKSATISAGVYLLSARLLDAVARGEARSLEHDVFEKLPAGSLAALAGPYRFIDIGTPESLAAAVSFFAHPAG